LSKQSIYDLIKEKDTEVNNKKFNQTSLNNTEPYMLQILYDPEEHLIETKVKIHRDILIAGLGAILLDMEQSDESAKEFTDELYQMYKQLKEIKDNGTSK
jgi:dsRNA-specific ribonuclease